MTGKSKSTVAVLVAVVLVLSVAVAPAPAIERTGVVLRELLRDLAESVRTLSRDMDQRATEIQDHESSLRQVVGEYERAQSDVEKTETWGRVSSEVAYLNRLERDLVEGAKNGILTIRQKVCDLREIAQGLAPQLNGAADFPSFRHNMGQVIHQIAFDLGGLQAHLGPENGSLVEEIKSNLVAYYEFLNGLPEGGAEFEIEAIDKTLRAFDQSLAKLEILRRRLELERVYLTRLNLTQLLRIIKSRLSNDANIPFVGDFNEAPIERIKAINQRDRLIRNLGSDESEEEFNVHGPTSSAHTNQVFEVLTNGNPFTK